MSTEALKVVLLTDHPGPCGEAARLALETAVGPGVRAACVALSAAPAQAPPAEGRSVPVRPLAPAAAGGNKTKAARQLGVARSSMRRALRR